MFWFSMFIKYENTKQAYNSKATIMVVLCKIKTFITCVSLIVKLNQANYRKTKLISLINYTCYCNIMILVQNCYSNIKE